MDMPAPDLKSPVSRRRSMVALFSGVVFMNTAMVGASAMATLIAADAIGPSWSGTPNAAGVLGTAIGTLGLATVMARRGRRTGLLLGYILAAAGALVAATSVIAGAFPPLVAGMILLGAGNGGAQLSRYAAADLYPSGRQGFALSSIVWAGTIGALAGPGLIPPAAGAAQALRMPPLAGSFLLALLAMLGAGVAAALIPGTGVASRSRCLRGSLGVGLVRVLKLPRVRIALAAMVAGQFAMVAVMTMTPLHIHLHGDGLPMVGGVLSAHMIGMFALSPLSGKLADRWGGLTAILCGIGTLVVAAMLAGTAPTAHGAMLPLALFLLGYGWNLCFVGGSSLLGHELPAAERTQMQGAIDSLVWTGSALASLASGGLLAAGGYSLLALVAGVISALPLVVILASRARLSAPAAEPDSLLPTPVGPEEAS